MSSVVLSVSIAIQHVHLPYLLDDYTSACLPEMLLECRSKNTGNGWWGCGVGCMVRGGRVWGAGSSVRVKKNETMR